MPYINVDEAYILDNTGLQVDQVVDIPYTDAALTDGQKEQARKNIAAGGTNPNLLDNPFFTVNQRGVAAGTFVNANGFVADRWQATGTTGATRNSDGSITVVDTMYHKLGDRGLDGKTVTLSALYTDGTIESNTFTWVNSVSHNLPHLNAVVYASANQIKCNGGSLNVKALKLELGTVSTLANDIPPNYAEELAKCQYYCRVITATANTHFATGVSASAGNFRVPLPYAMRTTPSVTYSGTISVAGASSINISAIAVAGATNNSVTLSCTATGITAGTAGLLLLANGATITISADL